jgi:hypothetical protein
MHLAEIMPQDLKAVQQQTLLEQNYQDELLFHLILSEKFRQQKNSIHSAEQEQDSSSIKYITCH